MTPAGFQHQMVVRRHFGAVLHIQSFIRDTVEPPAVRVVFGEQQRWCPGAEQPARPQRWVLSHNDNIVATRFAYTETRRGLPRLPRPGVTEPQRREEVQFGGLRAAIRSRNADED